MDCIELLKKYKMLLDEGIITQDEFDYKKKEVLAELQHSDGKHDRADVPTTTEPIFKDTEKNNGLVRDNIDSPTKQISEKRYLIVGAAVVAGIILLAVLCGSNSSMSSPVVSNTDNYYSNDDSSDYNSNYSYTDNGLDLLQGSWELVAVENDGETTYVTDTTYGGDLYIVGDSWDMTYRSTSKTTFTGTIVFDFEDTSTGAYVYDFYSDSGGYVKAAYIPKNKLLTVFNSTDIDIKNSSTWRLY